MSSKNATGREFKASPTISWFGLIRLGLFALLALLFLLSACSESSLTPSGQQPILVGVESAHHSSTAGNLIATAIQKVHDLDMVFYPRSLLKHQAQAEWQPPLNTSQWETLLALYPDTIQDQFLIGTMKGKDIRGFLSQRSQENYELDLEVAGLEYHIHFVGGIPQYEYASRSFDSPLEDEKLYRVGLSQFGYFSSYSFPGYIFRNNMNFKFKLHDITISAKKSLQSYLKGSYPRPLMNRHRGKVTRYTLEDVGAKSIREIQGQQHLSPLVGHPVITFGTVTALGVRPHAPGGLDVFIQDPHNDWLDETSEALHLYFPDENTQLSPGQWIRVRGVVYEELNNSGLGRTSLHEISEVKVLQDRDLDLPPSLPPPVLLGPGGRPFPSGPISSYRGDLNLKPNLNLNDGIDFWESLESMRITIKDLRVVGFMGGLSALEDENGKNYLNLYVAPEIPFLPWTSAGGLGVQNHQNSPHVLNITRNHLTKDLHLSAIFQVGQKLPGEFTGLLNYEKNVFNQGEYTLALPKTTSALKDIVHPKNPPALKEKGRTQLLSDEQHLTIASFNVQNLAGHKQGRLQNLALAIKINLQCPDIVTLVEVQDGNGIDFSGGSSAKLTLKRLLSYIDCPGRDYKALNIDPILHSEGGQPGGNIQVAILYDPQRLGFESRPSSHPLTEVRILPNGHLNYNPGRIAPNSDVFEFSRRSLIAEFSFRGEQLFVIGNHLNSKLGDVSPWFHQQPPEYDSENKRIKMASELHNFIEKLTLAAPQANIAMVGDFNAFIHEKSMQVLAGDLLTNLIETLPANDRYTTNHNGYSQPLDYIFVNGSLLMKDPEFEIIHMNSDYMGRLSDHDPLVSRFRF